MTYCFLITVLATAILLLLLLPWIAAGRLAPYLKKFSARFCPYICRYWILLAFLTGFLLALLAYVCRDTWQVWLDDDCKRLVLAGLALALWAVSLIVTWVARCGLDGLYIRDPKTRQGAFRGSLYGILLLLAFILLALIVHCCRGATQGFVPEWTFCHTVLIAFIVLFVVACFLKYVQIRYCEDSKPHNCERLRIYGWIAALLLLFSIVMVWRCCDRLVDEDYELAMVGIWWEGAFPDEQGVHLRWSFKEPLPFPVDGFDIQRRESGSGTWATLNTERIRPVQSWDGGGPPTGNMALPHATERLHPDSWNQFRDGAVPGETPFSDLLDMLARPPYAPLYFVETPDPAEFPVPPSNPYDALNPPENYLNPYYAAGTDESPMRPLAVWTWEPMTAINVAAMFPEVARMVGLYWIDRDADPSIEYDYRVVGYWPDRERDYVVLNISAPNTEPLQVPSITRADSPIKVGSIDSAPGAGDAAIDLVDDTAVGLKWTPPDVDPDDLIGVIDKITSVVFYADHHAFDQPAGMACPGSVDPSLLQPATRPTADGSSIEVVPPVTPTPLLDEATNDQTWPEYYFFHRNLEYGCHAYRVRGQDVFGRPSEPSPARILPVVDITAPPPPALLKATLYQRADRSMPADIRAAHFPDSSSNEYTLIVSWVWTGEMAERADDAKEFTIFLQTTDYANFVDINAPPVWRASSSWDAQLGSAVALSDTAPMPALYTGTTPPVTGSYYERVYTDDDLDFELLGLVADDTTPVRYGWIGVSTTDHDPYNNTGVVAAPVLIYARDFIPPEPPHPPPILAGPIAPIDEMGNRSVPVGWTGGALYRYALFRVDTSDLSSFTPSGTGTPACMTAPACDVSGGDESCVIEHEAFGLRSVAYENPEVFTQVSPIPLVPDSGTLRYNDSVDGTISSRWLYAAAAMDKAGNLSSLSCPGEPVLVEDAMPPRAPVISSVLATDGGIEVTWTVNPESDLVEYTVYRTADESRAQSRRRMLEKARIRPDGSLIPGSVGSGSFTGSGPYAQVTWADMSFDPGRPYFYRVDAVDLSGNRSELSEIASGSGYDATPPDPPVWGTPALSFNAATNAVTASWVLPPDDPDLSVQIQRREVGTRLWRSTGSWTEPAQISLEDGTGLRLDATYEYRIRAMDAAGNKGDWSAPPHETVSTAAP